LALRLHHGSSNLLQGHDPEGDPALVRHPCDPATTCLPAAHHLDGLGEHDHVLGAVDEPAEGVVLALSDGAVEVEVEHRDPLLGCF
jgi:hypothetical protein